MPALVMPMLLTASKLYTPPDVEEAHEMFGANCGPAACAAVLRRPVMTILPFLGAFRTRQYMNPTHMREALTCAAARYAVVRDPTNAPWPFYGLGFVQWTGPWCQPGVPVRAAYRQTHWIGVAQTEDCGMMLYDVNADAPDGAMGSWVAKRAWQLQILPTITATIPRAYGGWYIRWICQVIDKDRGEP